MNKSKQKWAGRTKQQKKKKKNEGQCKKKSGECSNDGEHKPRRPNAVTTKTLTKTTTTAITANPHQLIPNKASTKRKTKKFCCQQLESLTLDCIWQPTGPHRASDHRSQQSGGHSAADKYLCHHLHGVEVVYTSASSVQLIAQLKSEESASQPVSQPVSQTGFHEVGMWYVVLSIECGLRTG
ncbi:unnamed protein product [Ceratitis capitata]|uniref:(Mediterranean fruit fly) hypothetical protein n=1 Tax=Ceratitis capitata TaxID=7213 RepID=A0A811V3N4_CERCA|nr:unnamed protein product [Ceratitis capitata]